jgi:hypothetical protein
VDTPSGEVVEVSSPCDLSIFSSGPIPNVSKALKLDPRDRQV